MKLKISRKIILLGIIFYNQQLYAQGIEIGLSLCPNYAYRTVKDDGNSSIIYNGEKPMLGYSAGIYLLKSLTSKISIRTGLDYNRMGFSLGEIHLTNNQNEPLKTINPKRYFDYLTIPVIVQYQWSSKMEITPIAELGLNNSLFIAEKLNTDEGEIEKNHQTKARKYQMGILAGLGAKMSVNDHLAITILSNLNYLSFTVENTDDPIHRKLYSVGINCMVGYRIGDGK